MFLDDVSTLIADVSTLIEGVSTLIGDVSTYWNLYIHVGDMLLL